LSLRPALCQICGSRRIKILSAAPSDSSMLQCTAKISQGSQSRKDSTTILQRVQVNMWCCTSVHAPKADIKLSSQLIHHNVSHHRHLLLPLGQYPLQPRFTSIFSAASLLHHLPLHGTLGPMLLASLCAASSSPLRHLP
jgi:hypothetical protein